MDIRPESLPADFISSLSWNNERIRAMALYCSDGRWGEAFDEFFHTHLQLPRYDRLAVPGGPAWLLPNGDETGCSTAREQVEFLVNVHGLERMVLITHYACAYYGRRLNGSPDETLEAQSADVRRAAAELRGWYPEMHVETFLAMRFGCQLSFHPVPA